METKKYTDEELKQRKLKYQRDYEERTGNRAKKKYYEATKERNKAIYSNMVVRVKKDIADAYKKKCDENGISYSALLHKTIEDYIK